MVEFWAFTPGGDGYENCADDWKVIDEFMVAFSKESGNDCGCDDCKDKPEWGLFVFFEVGAIDGATSDGNNTSNSSHIAAKQEIFNTVVDIRDSKIAVDVLLLAAGDAEDIKNNGDEAECLGDKKSWFDMIKHWNHYSISSLITGFEALVVFSKKCYFLDEDLWNKEIIILGRA